jgi:putative colanic acid biosynthesis UDP-glucose lipid carrier transferase
MSLSSRPRLSISKVYAPTRSLSASPRPQRSGSADDAKPRWTRYLPVNGKEFVALQKIFDPLLAGELFWYTNIYSSSAANGILLHASILTVVVLTALFLSDSKVYEGYRKSRLWTLLGRVTEAWLKVVTALIIIGYFAKVSALFSRINFITWALLGWLLLIVAHIGSQKLLRFLRSHGANSQHIVFLGSRNSAVHFFRQVQQLPYLGLNLKAWFSMDSHSSAMPLPAGMPAPVGDIGMLERWLRENQADQIHFCSSDFSDHHVSMKQLVGILGNTSLPVYYVPEWVHSGMRCNVEQLGSLYLIELWGHEDRSLKLHVKRFFDFLAALVLILFLSPLLLLLALFVKSSSPGPIIFRQDRYGLRGERFTIYKFRTMTVIEKGDQDGLEQARRNDPRITPIGKFMRQWSLDELPQLFNVLNGSMSLVGPRPHAVAHNEEYRRLITGYMQRHQLRPGITGLAQVKGFRGETAQLSSMKNRIEADLQYLKDWSFLLDLEILIKTLLRLRSVNAY